MWEVEECVKGQLRTSLNAIEDRGGTIFQIIESTRNDNVLIIWTRQQRHQQYDIDNTTAMRAVGRR